MDDGRSAGGKRRVELGFDHRLDELAHPIAQTGFDRIKPIVEKRDRRLRLRMQNRRLRAIVGHGVVSTGAPTPDRLGFSTRRLRHRQFQPNPGRHHAPFFRTLFGWVAKTEPAAVNEEIPTSEVMGRYLGSKQINDRTDDDKTLILASRRPAPKETTDAGSDQNETRSV